LDRLRVHLNMYLVLYKFLAPNRKQVNSTQSFLYKNVPEFASKFAARNLYNVLVHVSAVLSTNLHGYFTIDVTDGNNVT